MSGRPVVASSAENVSSAMQGASVFHSMEKTTPFWSATALPLFTALSSAMVAPRSRSPKKWYSPLLSSATAIISTLSSAVSVPMALRDKPGWVMLSFALSERQPWFPGPHSPAGQDLRQHKFWQIPYLYHKYRLFRPSALRV